jgi:hypothetical protein
LNDDDDDDDDDEKKKRKKKKSQKRAGEKKEDVQPKSQISLPILPSLFIFLCVFSVTYCAGAIIDLTFRNYSSAQ